MRAIYVVTISFAHFLEFTTYKVMFRQYKKVCPKESKPRVC